MNILVGAHGTGKSSLIRKIKELKPYIYCTDGFSRPVKRIKEITQISDSLEQIIINELTVWNWLNNIDNIYYLSARSIIDAIVYSDYLDFDIGELMKVFVENNKKTIKYFYIPIEFELKSDNYRPSNITYQKDIDVMLKDFLINNNIDYQIISGDFNERVDKLLKQL